MPRIAFFNDLLDMIDYGLQRSPRTIISANPQLFQPRLVVVRNYATADQQNVIAALLPNELRNLREGCHMGPVQKAHRYYVHVFVDSHLGNLFGGRQEARIDYLHPGVPECSTKYQRASVMAVESRLRDQDPDSSYRFSDCFRLSQR